MPRATAPLLLSIAVHSAVALALVARPGPARVEDSPEHVPERPDLGGETFELPAPESFAPAPAPEAAPAPAPEAPAPAAAPGATAARVPAGRPARAAAAAGDGASGTAGPPALYGALGDRSATDLAAAFTRGFPQAASADPLWRTAPLGSAGRVTVTLVLDESGHIVESHVDGTPSPALASALRRTLALLGSRPFVARGRTTRLTVAARVSADEVHDGLHGDVFAIGGSFEGGAGQAFFALAIGRRIDMTVSEPSPRAAGRTEPSGR